MPDFRRMSKTHDIRYLLILLAHAEFDFFVFIYFLYMFIYIVTISDIDDVVAAELLYAAKIWVNTP